MGGGVLSTVVVQGRLVNKFEEDQEKLCPKCNRRKLPGEFFTRKHLCDDGTISIYLRVPCRGCQSSKGHRGKGLKPRHSSLRHWTQKEDDNLRQLYKDMSLKAMLPLFPGRTWSSLNEHVHVLGLSKKPVWTPEEDAELAAFYANSDRTVGMYTALAKKLKRPWGNLARRSHVIGVYKKIPNRWAPGSHPRGALGMKHTPETRRKISQISRGKRRPPFSDEHLTNMAIAMQRRLREHPGSFQRNWISQGTLKPRGIGGRRADLGDVYFRSAFEANYARFLNWQKIRWEYEVKTFWFESITRGSRSYTPDFWLPDEKTWHEVKGWMDQKSKTKLERMARYYPEEKVIVVGESFFRDCERKRICRLIPNWECSHNKPFTIEHVGGKAPAVEIEVEALGVGK